MKFNFDGSDYSYDDFTNEFTVKVKSEANGDAKLYCGLDKYDIESAEGYIIFTTNREGEYIYGVKNNTSVLVIVAVAFVGVIIVGTGFAFVIMNVIKRKKLNQTINKKTH